MNRIVGALTLLVFYAVAAPVRAGPEWTVDALPPLLAERLESIQRAELTYRVETSVELPDQVHGSTNEFTLSIMRPDRIRLNDKDTDTRLYVLNDRAVFVMPRTPRLEGRHTVEESVEDGPGTWFWEQQGRRLLHLDIAALIHRQPLDLLQNIEAWVDPGPLKMEEVDGISCVVLTAEGDVAHHTVWWDVQSGLIRDYLQVHTPPDPGATVVKGIKTRTTLIEAKINPEFSDDLFVPDIPEGAMRHDSMEAYLAFMREQNPPPVREPVDPGTPRRAPDFTLDTIDGTTVALASLTGKVVVIDFWATWCGPCVRAIPFMNDLANEFAADEVVVLGISTDAPDQRPRVEGMVKDLNIEYAILMDTSQVARAYGVRGIPALYFIDREGIIKAEKVGFSPQRMDSLRDTIRRLLAGEDPVIEPPPARPAAAPRERYAWDTNRFRKVWMSPADAGITTFRFPSAWPDVHLRRDTAVHIANGSAKVVSLEDGRTLFRVPLPREVTDPNERGERPEGFVLHDEGHEPVLVVLRSGYDIASERKGDHTVNTLTLRERNLSAFSMTGTPQWELDIKDKGSSEVGFHVLPDGPGRNMLAGFYGVRMIAISSRGEWLMDTPTSQSHALMVTDIDGNDLPEFTRYRQHVERYEWIPSSAPGKEEN